MPTITWWGHATATVSDSGVRVLADPLFTSRLGHLRRRRGPLPAPRAAAADLVVISHLHCDHLHLRSLAALPHGTRVLLPRGAVAAVPRLRSLRPKLDLTEVGPGDEVQVNAPGGAGGRSRAGGVLVRAVPALHDGRRWPIGNRRVSALGYVVTGAATTYFAGDTDLFPELHEAVGHCDVALLPVGGWGPRLGSGHLDARRAAIALSRLAASAAIPIHYGTFCPIGLRPGRWFDRPGRDFASHVRVHAPSAVVHELAPGESVDLVAPARLS